MNNHNQDNRLKRTWLFAAGFLGWFLANGLIWFWLSEGGDVSIWEGERLMTVYLSQLWVFPLNLIIMFLLLLVKKSRPIGQGVLAAFGANLIISLFLGLTFNAFCLIPFFSSQ